jgi:hypothetical protein
VVGGLGRVPRAVIGALTIGVAEEFSLLERADYCCAEQLSGIDRIGASIGRRGGDVADHRHDLRPG